jgi:drug/metabolite transporter (DMT)-like permease
VTPLLIRSMLLVFAASVVGSLGAVFLKFGSVEVGKSLLSLINRNVCIGVVLYMGSSVFYGLGIKGGQVSVLYPMVSLGYIWTMVWSRIFFKETFTRQKMLGLTLVLAGVILVTMGAARTASATASRSAPSYAVPRPAPPPQSTDPR